jgi:hypothetical protein
METLDVPGTRPFGPPQQAVRLCRIGMMGSTGIVPLILIVDIMYFVFGDGWINVAMPTLPFIFPLFILLFGRYFVFPVYAKRSLGWIRRFRVYVNVSVLFYCLVVGLNVLSMRHAKTEGAAAFFLVCLVALVVCLPFTALLWWITHKYRWYDPASRPSEWEREQSQMGDGAYNG